MTVGERLAFGFVPREFGLGIYFNYGTLWFNFFGFYLNFYFGRVGEDA